MLRQAGRTRPPASRDREPSIGCGVTPLPRASQVSENTGSAGGAIAAPRNNTTLEAIPDGSAPELQDATGSGAGSCEQVNFRREAQLAVIMRLSVAGTPVNDAW
jgi:hypothetical protein